jgi:hypothetical protein
MTPFPGLIQFLTNSLPGRCFSLSEIFDSCDESSVYEMISISILYNLHDCQETECFVQGKESGSRESGNPSAEVKKVRPSVPFFNTSDRRSQVIFHSPIQSKWVFGLQ